MSVQIDRKPDGFHQKRYALPPGATEVVLVRHGASEPIAPGETFPLLEGRGNPALAPEGIAQAELIAARFAAKPPDRLFATPLRRTQETAAAINAVTGIEVEVVPELIEVFIGELDGGLFRARVQEGDPVAAEVFSRETWEVIPGAEPAEEYAARLRAGVSSIVERTGPDRVAVAVVHGGVIGELCRQASESRPFAFVHSDNGSFSRLVVLPDGSWLLRSFNDTSHLDDGQG